MVWQSGFKGQNHSVYIVSAETMKFHLRMGSTRLIAPEMLPKIHSTYYTHSNIVSGMFVGDFDLNPTEISGKFATRFGKFCEISQNLTPGRWFGGYLVPRKSELGEKSPDSCVSWIDLAILKIWAKNINFPKSYIDFPKLDFLEPNNPIHM